MLEQQKLVHHVIDVTIKKRQEQTILVNEYVNRNIHFLHHWSHLPPERIFVLVELNWKKKCNLVTL